MKVDSKSLLTRVFRLSNHLVPIDRPYHGAIRNQQLVFNAQQASL